MSNVANIKKPTLESLAAEMRRLQERVEEMEDLIEHLGGIVGQVGQRGVEVEHADEGDGGVDPTPVIHGLAHQCVSRTRPGV